MSLNVFIRVLYPSPALGKSTLRKSNGRARPWRKPRKTGRRHRRRFLADWPALRFSVYSCFQPCCPLLLPSLQPRLLSHVPRMHAHRRTNTHRNHTHTHTHHNHDLRFAGKHAGHKYLVLLGFFIYPSTHPPIHPSILTTHTPNRHTQTHRHTDTQTHTASMRTQDKEDCTGGGGSSSRQSSGLLVCDHVVGSEESSRRRRDRTATGGRRYCHRCRGGSVMTLCGRRRFCCGTCDRLGSRWRSSAAHPRSGCCFVA